MVGYPWQTPPKIEIDQLESEPNQTYKGHIGTLKVLDGLSTWWSIKGFLHTVGKNRSPLPREIIHDVSCCSNRYLRFMTEVL